MGLSDRDYARDEPRGFFLGGERTMTTNLILINVGVFLVDLIFFQGTLSLDDLALRGDLFQKPWQFWQLLTYGFAHDPINKFHIVGNMLGLYFFGREIEGIYGRKEFLRLYLSLIVLSGLVYVLSITVTEPEEIRKKFAVIGASGAVVGIIILFAWHYPRKTILLAMVVPVPAWIAGCIIVGQDVYGAMQNQYGHGGTVACSVHLAGAALATIYYKTGWNLGRMLPARFSLGSLKPRPKLRLHDPEMDAISLEAEVDRILAKISEQGESSLTGTERKTLERASRRYQQRRR